ncbi:MAG: RAD55 family ATPase [Thermoplasmata archaeon]
MSDPAEILLYNLLHTPASVSQVVTPSGEAFFPVPKSVYLGAKTEELFERLRKRGVVERVRTRSKASCPHCGSEGFEVVLTCSVHGTHLGPSAPSVPPASVSPGHGPNHLPVGALSCDLCGGPPPQVAHTLQCVQCRRDIPVVQSYSKGEYMYRVLRDHLPANLGILESMSDAFREKGFRVSIPFSVPGKSGLEHHFDLSAEKGDTRHLLDVEAAEEGVPLSRIVVLAYYAKVSDLSIESHPVLVAFPRLGEEGRKLSDAYGLDSFDCPDAPAGYAHIRSVIEQTRREESSSTGIPGLDPLLGGGFIEGRIYLVIGDVGTGKTTFALQFLLAAAHQGGRGLLVTTTTKPSEVVEMADSLGLDLRDQMRKGRIVILDITQQLDELKSKGFADIWRYRAFLSRIIDDLSTQAAKLGADRIAIDTLTPLTPVRKYDEIREFIKDLTGLGRLLLITRERGIDGDVALEEYFVSGVIVLRSVIANGAQNRSILVQKNRGAQHDTAMHSYTISKGVGINIK